MTETTRTLAEIEAELLNAERVEDTLALAVRTGALKPDRTWKISMIGMIERVGKLRAERDAARAA